MAKTYIKTLRKIQEINIVGSSQASRNRLPFIPVSHNFSDMKHPDGTEFDAGDEGQEQDQIISQMQADAFLLKLLQSFNDRQKIILMYQLLREAGYNLNHEDCAQTISITRERYMVLLKDVKKRAAKILQMSAR